MQFWENELNICVNFGVRRSLNKLNCQLSCVLLHQLYKTNELAIYVYFYFAKQTK